MPMTLVSTVTITSGGSQIIFQNIPQTGKDLLLLFSIRDTSGNNFIEANIQPNDSGTTMRTLWGNGSSVGSNSSTFQYGGSLTTSNTFSSGQFYISNYTSSGIAKACSLESVAENNATAGRQEIITMLTSTTAPITSLFLNGWFNFADNSRASLYIIS